MVLDHFQVVQNPAARLLTNNRRRDQITQILVSLHWLSVRSRIQFIILVLAFRTLCGQEPSYVSDLLVFHTRSSDQMLLVLRQIYFNEYGD